MKSIPSILLFIFPLFLNAQSLEVQIETIHDQLRELKQQEADLKSQLEQFKLSKIQRDLQTIGLPSEDYVMHQAMALSYSEAHEQAAWVAHIILPDIIEGQVSRSNDFRVDPKITSGTAVEEDYFLKSRKADGTYAYDGFGYDRGHLAPSADFRWSETALSESYYYSNMSPQLADFNREGWAALESTLRGFIFRNPKTQLYVVTGGILQGDLAVIERSINKVSIPKYYFKVAVDLETKQGIGFIMPNQSLEYPLESYAVSIDEVERQTGLDFFNLLPDDLEATLESRVDKTKWIPETDAGDVEPIYPPSLPAGHFNSVQAKRYMGSGEVIPVCGTVVSTRYSRSGNLWLNIDKQFPNQIFSVYVRKQDLINFSLEGDKQWINQQVCFSGKIQNFSGVPTIRIEREEEVKEFNR